MKRLLVALDFDAAADRLLTVARDIAKATGARTHMVHVAPPEPDVASLASTAGPVRDELDDQLRSEHRWLDDRVERFHETGLEASCSLLRGDPVEAILREAQEHDCDTILVGTHGRSRVMEALLGSVSHELLRRSGRQVLVVPPVKEPVAS